MTRVSATPQVTQSTQPVPIGKKTPAPRLVLLVRSARLRHGKLVVRGVCSKGIRGKFITVRYISSSPPKKVRKRLKCKAFTWKAVLRVGKSRGGKITVEYHDPNGRGTTAVKHVTKK